MARKFVSVKGRIRYNCVKLTYNIQTYRFFLTELVYVGLTSLAQLKRHYTYGLYYAHELFFLLSTLSLHHCTLCLCLNYYLHSSPLHNYYKLKACSTLQCYHSYLQHGSSERSHEDIELGSMDSEKRGETLKC